MKSPEETLFDLHLLVQWHDKFKTPHTKLGTGEAILYLPPHIRAKLKQLRSEDIQNLRPDALSLPFDVVH